jgi:trimeric autotransporter adhesin
MTTMKTLISSQNSLLTILRSRSASILVALTLAAFAFASVPTALGVVPAPDGGYPGGNTAEGDNTLFSLTTGANNTAIGQDALFSNTTGSNNTANGVDALGDNTTGSFNTANGFVALFHNTTGIENTANGLSALQENTTGSFNTANGVDALSGNTIGSVNTADGFLALFGNTTGNFNTANGAAALQNNTAGSNNTAAGTQALSKNITGSNNTADGVNALFGNTTGSNNTASGEAALFRNTIGSSNIAVGVNAGSNLTIGNNNIHIGNVGVAAEANTIRVGMQGTQRRTFIAGISGVAVAGSTVVANANGQLGIAASSARFKDEIKPMDKASEAILALQPVTFYYKKEIDPTRTSQFGLVAEDVEKVNPALVMRDEQGKPYGVRYDKVNAMLLNEFLKEHRRVEKQSREIREQETMITELRKGMTTVVAQLKEQSAQIQKVNAQLATVSPSHGGLKASKFTRRRIRSGGPAPQVVNNP